MVVGYHVHAMVPSLQAIPALTFLGAGYTGVSLFFVLSGFVLAYNYLTPDATGVGSVRDFFVARFARVYAVYLIGMVVAFPIFVRDVQRASGETRTASSIGAELIATTASALALVQAWIPSYACGLNCPGWSLSAEAFFYALFPLLGLWLAKRKRATLLAIAAGAWMLSCSVALFYVQRDPDGLRSATAAMNGTWLNVLKFNPLVRLPEFAIGVATGLVFLRNPRAMQNWAPIVSIGALLILGVLFTLHEQLPYPLLHNGLLAALYALLVFSLASGTGAIANWLSTRSMKLLGEASFALYLLHVAVLVYIMKALSVAGYSMNRMPWLIALYLVVVQALAILVLKRIEEPARRAVRNRFSSRR
jgi:peptidoglycan/LPS O-acetylase OafA/YrhL